MRAEGYAVIYGKTNKSREVYDRGCLDGVDISEVKITDHNNNPISSTLARTLQLSIDSTGLKFITDIPQELTYGRDTSESIRNGNILGVHLFADMDVVQKGNTTHITKIRTIKGIIVTSSADGISSNVSLMESSKLFHKMSDSEYADEKEKLKLILELI